MRRVIALCGLAHSGKDTVASILLHEAPIHVARDSFAKPIKLALCAMLNTTVNDLEKRKDTVHPLLGVTYRHMMQTLGTEWGRNMVKNTIWIDLLRQRILDEDEDTVVVITDVRFPNEVEMLRSMGALVVHVQRPGYDSGVPSAHVSERGLPREPGDVLIVNDGTLEDLIDQVLDATWWRA